MTSPVQAVTNNGYANTNVFVADTLNVVATAYDMQNPSPQSYNDQQSPNYANEYPQAAYLPPADHIHTTMPGNTYQQMQTLPELNNLSDVSRGTFYVYCATHCVI